MTVWIILAGFLFVSHAWADPLIGGKEALTLLGDLKRHFSKHPYSILVLERHDRQPIHLEPIDAILFNPGEGSFEKVRTRDRNHRLVLNSPVGQPGERLTPERLERFLNLIKANHMVPYILKGTDGEERMVVFVDPYNVCRATQGPKGVLVSVEADPFGRARTLGENPIWFRKY